MRDGGIVKEKGYDVCVEFVGEMENVIVHMLAG